uniref:Transposase (Putative), gypsy type n=1 Tax=Tanacetum cinerariifolium TaxID=118510 RepID=A0A6L2JV95_TANCI|nr:hypothetical protein [Tanacetum cinerariifolium]
MSTQSRRCGRGRGQDHEFASEYGIPESLHPELPSPEESIVEFPEGKVGVYTKFFEFANFLIGAAKVSHFEINCRVLNIIPTLNLFRVFYIPSFNAGWMPFSKRPGKNTPQCYTKPFPTVVECRTNAPKDEMPSADMDLFSLISAPNPAKVKIGTRLRAAHKVPLLTATASRVIDMEDTAVASGSSRTPSAVEKSPLDFADEDPPQVITERGEETTTEVISESSLEKEVAAMGPVVNKRRRKRGNEGGANAPPKVLRKDYAQDIPATAKSVNDPDSLSYTEPKSHPERDISQSSRETATKVPTGHVASIEVQCGIFAESPESRKSTPFLSVDGSPEESHSQDSRTGSEDQSEGGRDKKLDQEIKSLKTLETEVHDLLNQAKNLEDLLEAEQVSTLRAQVTGKERIKAAFEQFKKYEDDRVNSRCAKNGCKIGCVFADVVYVGVAKGMSEGLKHRIEHGKADLDLAAIETYDPEADAKYVAALHALKDLKYPLGDSVKDAPQWIRELCPSSSQLKIPMYLEVHDPKDPWSFKEEILLEDAIAANISRAEKKKKCRVVCRTHGVGFAHHARSDGVLVSVPIVAPQGLAILLSDAATHIDISKNEASPRLLRSKSLPPMYNLDWP